jgi:predicted GNAT family acetyltransferase
MVLLKKKQSAWVTIRHLSGWKLVAMAVQRLHAFDFLEISAVCTHSDYKGRRICSRLVNNQLLIIISAGKMPYLHVKTDNGLCIQK